MEAQVYVPAHTELQADQKAEAAVKLGLQVTGHGPTSRVVTLPSVKASKTHRLKNTLLTGRIAADGLLLVLAFLAAYWMRYDLEVGRGVKGPESSLSMQAFYPYIAVFVPLTLGIFWKRGLYALPRGASWLEQTGLITGASLIGVSLLTLSALLLNVVLPSRLIFIYLWLCTILVFGAERLIYRRMRVWFWKRGYNIRRALVVGDGVAGQRIMKDIVERPELGYELVGYLHDEIGTTTEASWQVPISRRSRARLRPLGASGDFERIISQHFVQEVIVALPATGHAQTLAIMDSCRRHGVDFKLVPDLFEMRFNEVRIDALNGVPLVGVKDVALQGLNLLLKRLLDIALACVILTLMALPMLAIALIIKLNSPGPILFRQKRVGKGGKTFVCLKFRSMYQDAEAKLEEIRHLNEVDGPIFKMKNDPRLTRVGKILRSTSLDELPQIFNILKGEMSWVGPRPPTPDEVAKYNDWHHKRLDTTAGLTGLWQVSGRSDLSFDEMVKLDLYYAENWSLAVDIMIMLRTIPAVLKRSGAY